MGSTTFAALAVPNYRRYIAGQAISLVGTWMQMAAQSWLPTGRAPGQLREGLRYVRRTPALATPLAMMALVGCLAYEFQVSLPFMAREGLHVGAAGYGFMTAAMGVGAVGGGLVVAARGRTGLAPLVLAAAGFGVVLGLRAVSEAAEGK